MMAKEVERESASTEAEHTFAQAGMFYVRSFSLHFFAASVPL